MDPIFPHHMWNLQERSSTCNEQFGGRTTNSLEAYHHSFNALVSCHSVAPCQHLMDTVEQSPQSTSPITKHNNIHRGSTFTVSAEEKGVAIESEVARSSCLIQNETKPLLLINCL